MILLMQVSWARSLSHPNTEWGHADRASFKPRHREGRRPHNSETKVTSNIVNNQVFSDWDGQPSWEWEQNRTLYFEPVAGLGNRLRALGELSGLSHFLVWTHNQSFAPNQCSKKFQIHSFERMY